MQSTQLHRSNQPGSSFLLQLLGISSPTMLTHIDIEDKTIGTKVLLKNCSFGITEGAKIAIIGKNGAGKSTLFRMLTGEDTDFHGSLEQKKGARIILTQQEHFGTAEITPLDYIKQSLPHYTEWQTTMQHFEEGADTSLDATRAYSEAESLFRENGYYSVDERIVEALERYGVTFEQAFSPFHTLSGGEKRFVELVRVSFADADLVLLDEPTNHMDYVGKAQFTQWLAGTPLAVCVISHDRDVLEVVSSIYELRDQRLHRFPGNYTAYLRQNGVSTITRVSQYEESLKRLENLHKQRMLARTRKLSAKSDSGRNNAKTQEERLTREYNELKLSLEKPSFWIDQETVASTRPKLLEGYQRYKDRTIHVRTNEVDEYRRTLLSVEDLSLGYEAPLFSGLDFTLAHGDRLHIKGRNGAGKSTLIRTLLATIAGETSEAWIFAGTITATEKLRIGLYEQEVDEVYLPMTLGHALTELYHQKNVPLTDQALKQVLASYLFDPLTDQHLQISQLSGGQKARFQLISMLCANPNLLILDEPTNHLDLPSIEELEKALRKYEGAILFVSHDSYFVRNIEAESIEI